MPDFNGINPFGVPFNTNRQTKKNNQEPDTNDNPSASNEDPYADLKVSPDHVYNLLSSQSGFALRNVNVDNMERMMHASTGMVSPEEHAKVTSQFRDGYRKEFGSFPPPDLLEEMVDNYLIGQVVIQSA